MIEFLIGFVVTFAAGIMLGAAIVSGARTRRRRGSASRIPVTTHHIDAAERVGGGL